MMIMEMVTKRSFQKVHDDDDLSFEDEGRQHDAKLPVEGQGYNRIMIVIISIAFLMMGTSFVTLRISNQMNNGGTFGGRTKRRWIPTLLSDIDVYPKYKGTLVPRGRITIRFEDDESEFLVRYELEGVEKNCENCAIHIHEGTSCEEPLLGLYYNTTLYDVNPWTMTEAASMSEMEEINTESPTSLRSFRINKPMYKSNDKGIANNAFIMSRVGIGSRSMNGHVVVIHSSTSESSSSSEIIGCGVLRKYFNINFMTANIDLYPGYTTQSSAVVKPTGIVKVMAFEDNVLRITGSMDGLEPNCNRCGIHIHKGLTCGDDILQDDDDAAGPSNRTTTDEINALVGDHWFHEDVNDEDAWLAQKATYTTDKKGHTDFTFYVYNGYDFEDNIDHALVVHGQNNIRIGCGILKPQETS